MTTELENGVREAMRARAGALPNTALARVRAVDYRPRPRRLPAAAALACAATAGTAVAVMVAGGTPAAYAGWSATPTSASTPSPQAAASCQDQLASSPAGPRGQLGSGPWQNVLTDVRGPFTVSLFQDDGAYAACFTSASFTEVNQIASSGGAGVSGTQVGSASGTASSSGGGQGAGLSSTSVSRTSSGDLENVMQTHLSTSADGAYTLVDGRTASGVTGVTLVQQGGQDVVATVDDGWFIAWWPGDAAATSVQVATVSGTASEQLEPLPMPEPSGPGSPSSGGPVSGSGSTGNSGAASGGSGNSGGAAG